MGVLGIGIGLWRKFFGVSYCDEYQTVYDSFTDKPSGGDAIKQNTWVESLIDNSLWDTQKDILYNFAVHTNDNGEAQINWIDPGTHDCTLVNGPTFTAYEGFTGDGLSYIDSTWNPSTDATNYTRFDAIAGCFMYAAGSQSDGRMFGSIVAGEGYTYILPYRSGTCYANINSASVALPDQDYNELGYYAINRTDDTNVRFFNPKGDLDADYFTISISASDFYIFCTYQNGSPNALWDGCLSTFFAGASITDQQRSDEEDITEAYMDANGKGVIP
jgi:hypothetical protein